MFRYLISFANKQFIYHKNTKPIMDNTDVYMRIQILYQITKIINNFINLINVLFNKEFEFAYEYLMLILIGICDQYIL